jgi:protein disulfide-isomerase
MRTVLWIGLLLGAAVLVLVVAGHADPPARRKAAGIAAGSDGHFITSYKTALSSAAATHRPILIDFTGSDWCPWCIKLDQEILSTPAFIAWASHHVILLTADFPRQTQQSDALARQNHELAATWSVNGFPTIIVIDAAEKKLAQSGYSDCGPERWIDDLEQRMKNAQ